jgi:putative nucleotidyltransferase with HDIG domain
MVISARPKSPALLENVLHRIEDLSTLPHSMLQVIRVTNDPLSTAKDLAKVLESDPALCTRLLRCANSVIHGLRARVETVQHAVTLLGFSRVRSLALTATVCNIFQNDFSAGPYSRRHLWDHMIAVAVTAREIAESLRIAAPEEVFIAGLLHDIGILLEDQYLHKAFSHLMANYPTGRTLVQAEEQWFGFDHTLLGATVAMQWNLPELVWKTIRHHHSEQYSGPHAPAIACVELANVMCTAKGLQSVGLPIHRMSTSVLTHLGIGRKDIHPFVERMNHELAAHSELFDLIRPAWSVVE